MSTPTAKRILGIEIAGSEALIAIVERTTGGTLTVVADVPGRIAMAVAGESPGANLNITLQSLQSLLKITRPNIVGIIRADQNSGVDRIKMETLVELAAHGANTPISPYHIATINSFRKKASNIRNAEAILAGPKYLVRAKLCALRCLEDA